MNTFKEPLRNLFTRSRLMILDVTQIPASLPDAENIQKYFEACDSRGIDPRLPENRQAFNERMLASCRTRYLVSRYAEDRSAMLACSQIAREGRTLHLGIDIFARGLESVIAPCNGTIIRTGQEPGTHSFGYYLFLEPDTSPAPLLFFGHLSRDLPEIGHVMAGQKIARLGDYINNENGGWSRHLHLQLFAQLPRPSEPLIGYTSESTLAATNQQYPDPFTLFPHWKLE